MTTVKELIEQLKEMDPDAEMWTAIDDKGNGYNTVRYAPTYMYTLIEEKYRTDEMYGADEIEEAWEDDQNEDYPSKEDVKRVVVL